MDRVVQGSPSWRSNWLIAMVLIAMLFGGLLPQGWMPAEKADGIGLVICTAAGMVQAELETGAGDQPGSRDGGTDPVCGFAVAKAPAAPPVAPGLPPIAGNWRAIALPADHMADQPAHPPVRLPPSQGPPAH